MGISSGRGYVAIMTHPEDDTAPEPTLPEEELDTDVIATRAGGRPPEERSSDDPEAQAKAILGESEERIRATDES